MELVFNCLNDSVTRVRFSAVCKLWRLAAQRCHCLIPPQFPWIMLVTELSNRRMFFSLSDGVTHELHLPELKRFLCDGSFEGWLVMQTLSITEREIFLINPLSKAKINLPAMFIDDSVDPKIVQMPDLRAYLSSPPILDDGVINNNCWVAGIDFMHNLYLCRLGDQSWTRQDFNGGRFDCHEILFYDGSFIAMERTDECINILESVLELDDPHLKLRFKSHSLPLPIFGEHDDSRLYQGECPSLIEWHGELYLVFPEVRRIGDIGTILAFRVSKLDSSWNLVPVKNLRDAVIFLLNFQPGCFSVKDFPLNLKGNCIC